jgi:hypothetical protein
MNKADMAAEEKKWKADADLRTLIEAEKIKKDKGRYGAAMKCHAEQMKALATVKGDMGGKTAMKMSDKETY